MDVDWDGVAKVVSAIGKDWGTLGGAFLGAAATLAVTAVTNRAAARREERAADRTERREIAAREDAQRARLRDERVAMYVEFLAACDAYVNANLSERAAAMRRANEARARLVIVADSEPVRRAADKLADRLAELDPRSESSVKAYLTSAERFAEAARHDLGDEPSHEGDRS